MEFDVVVETPMGSRNKYEMDQELGRIRLDRTLFTAMQYPADYGYVPNTLAEDDEPLDAMVLIPEKTFPGCRVVARVIGVFWMRDQSGPDAKLLCVPASDPRQQHIEQLANLPWHLVEEIAHFFAVYKEIEPGKCTEVHGWQDRELAEKVAQEAFARFGRG